MKINSLSRILILALVSFFLILPVVMNQKNLTKSQSSEELFTTLRIHTIAENIANGHAFKKHVLTHELRGITSKEEFQSHIEQVMSHPTKFKKLSHDRYAFLDEGSGTVVIVNFHASDNGTAFRPRNSLKYFNNLR